MRLVVSVLVSLFFVGSALAMPPPPPYFATRDMAFTCKLELLQADTLNVVSYATVAFGWKKGEEVGGIGKTFSELAWVHHEMILDPFWSRTPAKATIPAPADLNLNGDFSFYFHSGPGNPPELQLRGKLRTSEQDHDDTVTLVAKRAIDTQGELRGRIEANRATAAVFQLLHRELEIVCTEK